MEDSYKGGYVEINGHDFTLPLGEFRTPKITTSDYYEDGFKAGKQEGIREVVEWLRQYAIRGGRVQLEYVLIDLDVHSPYGKPS